MLFCEGRKRVETVYKIAAIGVLITVLSQVLNKAGREEIGTMTILAGLVVVLAMVVSMISDLFGNVRALFQLY